MAQRQHMREPPVVVVIAGIAALLPHYFRPCQPLAFIFVPQFYFISLFHSLLLLFPPPHALPP